MEAQGKNIAQELVDLLSATWEGIAITAGVNSGIYEQLSLDTPVSVNEIARKLNFEESKLDKWFYLMENSGIIKKNKDKYTLTEKGNIFSSRSPIKDILGMFHLNEFFMQAAINGKDTFKKGQSLDKLSEGKISRDYQPKVSDNFSNAIVEFFKKFGISGNDTLLDVGCGRGTFLRHISGLIPGVKLTGMDFNLFAIETGKKEINALELSDRIKLMVGDINEDLSGIEDNSYDWTTAINIFHFVPEMNRLNLMEDMIRISRKGVFMSQVIVEKTSAAMTADPLMGLLWNDYTGFFRKSDLDEINNKLSHKHKNYTFRTEEVMVGNSTLMIVLK